MPWPDVVAYNEAIQNPRLCFQDAELRSGTVAADALGLPRPCTGNFAAVYQVRCPNDRNWAVKCFTREVPELHRRYDAISGHLNLSRQQGSLPFMVDFEYLTHGIRYQGKWFPILKMRWVQGLVLNQWVREHLRQPQTLVALADLWLKLARELRTATMAHGDLQHGNVLLVPQANGYNLKLIDYDGMFVPNLAGHKSGELGHPHFQHPRRFENPFHAEVDRFPHLVIYTAIRALAVNRKLWDQFNNDDNLLFREDDFKTPGASPLFLELWKIRDPAVRALVGQLILATQNPAAGAPFLPELMSGSDVKPLAAEDERRVQSLLLSSAGPIHAVPRMTAATPQSASPAGGRKGNWQTPKSVGPPAAAVAGIPSWARPPSKSRQSKATAPGVRLRQSNNRIGRLLLVTLLLCAGIGFLAVSSGYFDKAPLPNGDERTSQPIATSPSASAATLPRIFKGHTGVVSSVAFAADGKQALSGSHDKTVRLWHLQSGKEVGRLDGHTDGVTSAVFSSNGERVLSGSWDGTLRLWDVNSLSTIRSFEGHVGNVYCVALSPDGQLAASGGNDHTVRLWDVNSGNDIFTFKGHTDAVHSVKFLPDGSRIVSGSWDGTIRLWDLSTRTEVVQYYNGHPRGVTGVAFSRDGGQLLSGGMDGKLRLWNTQTGQFIRVFEGHDNAVNCVALSPDGRRALSGSYAETVWMWDAEKGTMLKRIEGHQATERVTSVAFSPDGAMALSGSSDKTLRLWTIAD